ncbi:MAG: deoxyribose-phosphate aldolase [candidate division Zixibacteria bacterium]|nr:deoxyribose-phosphate aldolase [candidate division Zixibacteria bacterium]
MPAVPTILTDLNLRFDHAALAPEVNELAIRDLCSAAILHDLYAVCVNPAWVATAASLLRSTNIKVVSVVGFPLGANRTDIKVAEAYEAVEDGAREIDMVANIGWILSGRFTDVETEIRKVRRQLPPEVLLKVIIEAGILSHDQQVEATKAVVSGGAQFVKTSTGFFGGATVEQVKILHAAGSGQIEIKASGGIRTVEDCRTLLAAGASRLGSSSCPEIMREFGRLFGN